MFELMPDREYDVTSVNKSLNLLCIYCTSNLKVFLKVLSTNFPSSKKKNYNAKMTDISRWSWYRLENEHKRLFLHVLRKMLSYGSNISHFLRPPAINAI